MQPIEDLLVGISVELVSEFEAEGDILNVKNER